MTLCFFAHHWLNFPFQSLVCTFQSLVCTFQTLVRTFQTLKRKNDRRKKLFCFCVSKRVLDYLGMFSLNRLFDASHRMNCCSRLIAYLMLRIEFARARQSWSKLHSALAYSLTSKDSRKQRHRSRASGKRYPSPRNAPHRLPTSPCS